jgi:phenylpropionate dioxygenase-like ring-hydroxylating dioxygenase large terminal subunit
MNTTLANYWHPVAISYEVSDQPRSFKLLGVPIVLFRDDEGVVAFKDLCIHRGTALSLGWVENGRITCAYHGWQYDRTGTCTRIPSLRPGHPIPKRARAISYPATEAYGLVWVALEDPAAPLPTWPGDEWNDPSYRGMLAQHYVWRTSSGRAIENFLDFSHFPWVHEGLLGTRDRTVMNPHEVLETPYGLTYTYQQERPPSLHTDWKPQVVRNDYYVHMPFFIHDKKTIPDTGNITLLTLIASPTDVNVTRLFLFLLRNYELDADDESFRAFCDKVLGQDQTIVESQRPEEIPTDLRDELHLKVPDAAAIMYRRLLGQIGQSVAFMP